MSSLNKDLLFIKKQLIMVGYPGIVDENVNYIKLILSTENRLRVLAWICKAVINDDIDMNSPELLQTIQEIFYTDGFCIKQDLETSLLNLKIKQLVPIVKRALSRVITQNKTENETCNEILDIDDIERVSKKLSVLPLHMKPKLISVDEQSKLRRELESKINTTKEEISTEILRLKDMKNEEFLSTPEPDTNVNLQELDSKISELDDFAKKVKDKLCLPGVESIQESDNINASGDLIQRTVDNMSQLFNIYSVPDYLSQQTRLPENSCSTIEMDEMTTIMNDIFKS